MNDYPEMMAPGLDDVKSLVDKLDEYHVHAYDVLTSLAKAIGYDSICTNEVIYAGRMIITPFARHFVKHFSSNSSYMSCGLNYQAPTHSRRASK